MNKYKLLLSFRKPFIFIGMVMYLAIFIQYNNDLIGLQKSKFLTFLTFSISCLFEIFFTLISGITVLGGVFKKGETPIYYFSLGVLIIFFLAAISGAVYFFK